MSVLPQPKDFDPANYVIIDRTGSYLVATHLNGTKTLLGTDDVSGKLSAPGGQKNASDRNLYRTATREAWQEVLALRNSTTHGRRPKLLYRLIDARPVIFLSRMDNDEPEPNPQPGQVYKLRFYWRVHELTGFTPAEGKPRPGRPGPELINPHYAEITLEMLDKDCEKHEMRPAFRHALKEMSNRKIWPQSKAHSPEVAPDFIWIRQELIRLKVDPDNVYLFSNRRGKRPPLSSHQDGVLLLLLDEAEAIRNGCSKKKRRKP